MSRKLYNNEYIDEDGFVRRGKVKTGILGLLGKATRDFVELTDGKK